MLKTTDIIIKSKLSQHIFNSTELAQLLDNTPASRYGLINKALKSGELIRIQRGLYTLADDYLTTKWSKFYIANKINSHSYITAETALDYHGWIPEKVTLTISAISLGRNNTIETPYGDFKFVNIPVEKYEFLTCVERHIVEQQPFFIAKASRALFDYIYINKINWQGLDYLTESLRIDLENIQSISKKEFEMLKTVYCSNRVLQFLDHLEKEVTNK